MALGLNIVIIIGEFDISFEAITVFCGTIPVILIMQGLRNVPLVWTIGLAFGLGLSLINAVNVIYGGVPSFIATLGMMTVLAGISLGLTHGDTTYPATYPAGFEILGRWVIADLIPFPVIVFIIGAVIVVYLLDYRPLGRHLYAIGGNPQTSVHVGIKVKKLKLIAFLMAGAIYAVAGITLSSMLSSCNSNMGSSFFLPAITTCFLGATFITEGVPNPRGTIVASLLLAILVNGFFITNVAFYGQDIIQGIILIVAVGVLVVLKRKQTI
jgi:ribose/xylose/arabinose/galactoside ABC-type transport system permease subunit